MKQRTGLGGGIHQLRKTFASYWAMSGRSLYKLRAALGHESMEELLIYAALEPDGMLEDREFEGVWR